MTSDRLDGVGNHAESSRATSTSSNPVGELARRPRIAGDSNFAEQAKIAARAHQTMIWLRAVMGYSARESHW
jgi:hypothetical protein